jgi:hypothetical protein
MGVGVSHFAHDDALTAHELPGARLGSKRFGSEGAIEELVAELGAAFLRADLDLTLGPRGDHAAYIANWLEVLKSDNRAIFTAASHAQHAADFINGLQPAPALVGDCGSPCPRRLGTGRDGSRPLDNHGRRRPSQPPSKTSRSSVAGIWLSKGTEEGPPPATPQPPFNDSGYEVQPTVRWADKTLSMNIEFSEAPISSVAELERVPISSRSTGYVTHCPRQMVVAGRSFRAPGRGALREELRRDRWEGPTWADHFDISNWGSFGLVESSAHRRAVVVFNTADVVMLEGRRDPACCGTSEWRLASEDT